MERTFTLGKVDYEGRGKSVNRVELEVRWNNGRFSVCGAVWDARGRDWLSGGQNVEEVAALFPDNPVAQEILALWRQYHLNDMQAGSPAQMAWLKENPAERNYEKTSADLRAAGLNPDPNYLHNGKPYSYGSAWLMLEIPPTDVARIEALLTRG